MADIGAMLRDARMRERLDVSELEARTKIRAKYLRAMEEEEWDLLPGPTFTKSFLRTYSEALGLDARALVEEYKLRHERLSDVEMQPIVPSSSAPGARRGRGAAPPAVPRWALVLAGLVALVVVLAILGSSKGGGGPTTARHPATAVRRASGGGATASAGSPHARPQRRLVTLTLRPSAQVYVCLVAAGGRHLLNGVTLAPGASTPRFRSRRFELTLGNGSVTMLVDGRRETVPQSSSSINYRITPRGRTQLSASRAPTCP